MSAMTHRIGIELELLPASTEENRGQVEEKNGSFLEEAGMPPMPQEIVESGGFINFILTGPLAYCESLLDLVGRFLTMGTDG